MERLQIERLFFDNKYLTGNINSLKGIIKQPIVYLKFSYSTIDSVNNFMIPQF